MFDDELTLERIHYHTIRHLQAFAAGDYAGADFHYERVEKWKPRLSQV